MVRYDTMLYPTSYSDKSKSNAFGRIRSRRYPPFFKGAPGKDIIDYQKKERAEKKENETQAHQDKFDDIIDKSHRVLFKAGSIFPFELFPDDISVEFNQVNICRKDFFLTQELHSIPIVNILDVQVQTAPFFATLQIIDNSFIENLIELKYLKRSDAEKARRIIQGLIILNREGVDMTKVKDEDLIAQIEQLGSAQAIEKPLYRKRSVAYR